jgi:hypothetical protein
MPFSLDLAGIGTDCFTRAYGLALMVPIFAISQQERSLVAGTDKLLSSALVVAG